MEGNIQQGKIYGTTDIVLLLTKIFGIIGMIFIGISLAVPWASYAITGTTWSLSLNGWGVSTDFPESSATGFYKYLSDPFYINAMQSGITEGLIAGIFFILVFVFAIITLLLSIKAFRSIGKSIGLNKNYLFTGIFAIVTIVLCVIGVIQANSYGTKMFFQQTGYTIDASFGYTWGFILTIVAMIFFFINYALPQFIMQSNMTRQRAPYQQPQVMYTSQQQPTQQTPPGGEQQPAQQTPPPVSKPPAEKQAQTGKKFCPGCGAELQANNKFCPSCGAKI